MSNRYKTIVVDGVRKLEHVAVWEERYGPKPEGCDIHHKNGDPLDNRLENLEEVKRKQREHRAAHADEIKARAAAMRAERREYLAAKQRLYVAKRDGKSPEVIAACEARVAEEKAKLTFKR